MSTAETRSLEARRAALRSDITLAGRGCPPTIPATFIAVNPLAGLETMPFEQAIRRAGDLYGTRGTLSESTFRGLYRTGRITDADLDAALIRRHPSLPDRPDLRLGERLIGAVDLMRGDLLYGTELWNRSPPSNPLRTARPGRRRHRRHAGREVVLGILRRRRMADAGP